MRDDAMCKNILASYLKIANSDTIMSSLLKIRMGALRYRPFMRGEQIESKIGRQTVDYCSYGFPYRKSTDIWTSFEWHAKSCTKNVRCDNGLCEQGNVNTKGKFEHHQTIEDQMQRR